jgi:hypothetical protein
MSGLRRLVADLWDGRLPLARVFWEYTIVYGSFANLIATLVALAAFAHDWIVLGLAIHLLPVPYNLLMIVSVWRSANRYSGPTIWSALARPLVLVWAALAFIL